MVDGISLATVIVVSVTCVLVLILICFVAHKICNWEYRIGEIG